MAVITQTITKREGDLCFSFFMSIMLSSFLSFLYPPLPLYPLNTMQYNGLFFQSTCLFFSSLSVRKLFVSLSLSHFVFS